jgi:tetraacyldisaccharide 4'-kinase
VLRARTAPQPGFNLKGQRVLAFAGIGRPEKFFATLSEMGADVHEGIGFPDHHFYTSEEIKSLKSKARAAQARLITTEKDFVRLTDIMREDVEALPVSALIEPLTLLDELLDRIGLPL